MMSDPAQVPDSMPGTQPVWRGSPQPPWPGMEQPRPGPRQPQPGMQPAPGPQQPQPGMQPAPGPRQPQPGMQPAPGPQQPQPGWQPGRPGPLRPRPGRLTRGATRADGPASAEPLPAPDMPDHEDLAMLGYVAVPFLGPCVPLVIYLLWKQKSEYVRRHSAQALNLSLTLVLYGVCAVIAAAILALDSIGVAVAIIIPLAAALWLVNVGYAVTAGLTADRGGFQRIPGWLCATMVR
jgi:uncharacterized protein